MDWHQIPWNLVTWIAGSILAFIVWLVRLEMVARSTNKVADQNEKDLKAANEKIELVNSRVGATETLIAEVRAAAITRNDLRDVEERVTRSVEAVGKQVTGEVDRLVRVLEKPSRTTRAN